MRTFRAKRSELIGADPKDAGEQAMNEAVVGVHPEEINPL